jgi:hypothetical protein
MAVFEKMLQNSYRVSGPNSSRLLLMTATPITKDPFELFKLINLCKEAQLPTTVADFKDQFMQNDEIDRLKLADSLAGYISYLNLAKDVSQFAQAVHTTIEVPISIDEAQIALLPKYEESRALNTLTSELEALVEEKEAAVSSFINACSSTRGGGVLDTAVNWYQQLIYNVQPPPPPTEFRSVDSEGTTATLTKPVNVPSFKGSREFCVQKAKELYREYDVKIADLEARIAQQKALLETPSATKQTAKLKKALNPNYQVTSLQKCLETVGKKKESAKKTIKKNNGRFLVGDGQNNPPAF